MEIEFCEFGERNPVKEFLLGFDSNTTEKLSIKLRYLEEVTLSKCLSNRTIKKFKDLELYEIRIKHKRNAYRFWEAITQVYSI